MRLRNKKTGEVVILIDHIFDDYKSLAEVNEEWENVEDINVTNIPLIKDEKIRKAVRAWASSFDDADEIKASDDYKEFWIDGYLIEFERSFDEVESEHTYRRTNITELCGDEE